MSVTSSAFFSVFPFLSTVSKLWWGLWLFLCELFHSIVHSPSVTKVFYLSYVICPLTYPLIKICKTDFFWFPLVHAWTVLLRQSLWVLTSNDWKMENLYHYHDKILRFANSHTRNLNQQYADRHTRSMTAVTSAERSRVPEKTRRDRSGSPQSKQVTA